MEIANHGTVFLDEIAEMPMSIQAKLLTFLEKKQFKRLGSGKDIKVDVRIIAATNQNLLKAIEKKKFRKDLYYRLNVVSIHAPPLRERKDDILALSNYFLEEFSKDMGKIPKTLLPEVEDIFNAHPWHGNVRELRNVIERAVIFCKGRTVNKDLLPQEMLDYKNSGVPQLKFQNNETNHAPIDTALLKVEKQILDDALKQTQGNKTMAASLLGISRYSLTRRINKLARANELQKESKRPTK